jgi:hypothetical protein
MVIGLHWFERIQVVYQHSLDGQINYDTFKLKGLNFGLSNANGEIRS